MSYTIWGCVTDSESGCGVPNVVVSAFDKDLLFDDLLGEVITDAEGNFRVTYEGSAFNRFFDSRPDIYVRVKTLGGRLLYTTENSVRSEAGKEEHFAIELPHSTLVEVGLDISPFSEKLKVLTCLKADFDGDPLVAEIRRDLARSSTVLDLMRSYLTELEGELDNNAPTFLKLAKLFEYGITPDRVEGHHYGITIGLRTGDKKDIWADYGNVLGVLWSTALGEVPPWVGKTFNSISDDALSDFTDGAVTNDASACLGINLFNEIEESPLNTISIGVLDFWLNLRQAPEEEQAKYGYERVGGNFIARRERSVYHATDREVFRLNYRWPKLNNRPPLSYLIDEIVEIAEGLYLGQLLFATKHLLVPYNPALPDADNGYEHFGYFLLMNEEWRSEARRLFPYTGIPRARRPRTIPMPQKFTTFTFAELPDSNCRDDLLAEVQQDVAAQETIIDLLKLYSDELKGDIRMDSPYFARLNELFNRGVCPREIKGFLRGALISFQSEGLFGILDMNTLNMAWNLGRLFTPWTGKTFEDIEHERLMEITEGQGVGHVPAFWGANTYSLRTTRKKIVGQAMKVLGIWTEDPAPDEKRRFGIDMKSFFFIGHVADSVNADNRGKQVFRFNYRWPKLRTFPPDNYCFDEIVQIAEGLYLGQLMYATNLLKKYDANEDHAEYKYRNFGYFLLMDEDWHRRRLKIGFDLDNT